MMPVTAIVLSVDARRRAGRASGQLLQHTLDELEQPHGRGDLVMLMVPTGQGAAVVARIMAGEPVYPPADGA